MESCQSKNFFLVTKQMVNKVRQTIAIYKGLQEFNNKTNKQNKIEKPMNNPI